MMKLLLCKKCSDIFVLRVGKIRLCECGDTGGQYINSIDAQYWGDSAQMLGFANHSLVQALKDQIAKGDRPDYLGREFKAFLIPNFAPSIKRIEKPDAVNEAVLHDEWIDEITDFINVGSQAG